MTATPNNPWLALDLGAKGIRAFPNPAKGQMKFVFRLDAAAAIKIQIYNLAGERVASLYGEFAAGSGQSLVWDLDGVASGVYVARVFKNGSEKAELKVAVVR
jgi:hypothetical protein